MVRNSAILRTAADQLMSYVSSKEKVTIQETAKALKIPEKTVQGLVDFLVEEKVFGIEYKFTTPYIYLSKKDFKQPSIGQKKEKFDLPSKEEFYNKAKQKNIPYQKIEILWKIFLEKHLTGLKKKFYEKARQKNISEIKINKLWEKYISYI